MSEQKAGKRVRIKEETKEQPSSSSSSDDEDNSSSSSSSSSNVTEKNAKKPKTKKASKVAKKSKASSSSSASASSCDLGPMLSIKHPNREGSLWSKETLGMFPVGAVLGEIGSGGKVEMTADALAILQSSVDVLTDKALSESLLFVKLLQDRNVMTAPATGGPYIKGEKNKAPRDGEKLEKPLTIYPRHLATVIRSDPWLASVTGERLSMPSDVCIPSITLAAPKAKKTK